MIDLGYERISHLIAIATLSPDDDSADRFLLSESAFDDREISIRFSNYIKSQLHYYIDVTLSKRSFFKYVNAYHYLEGDMSYESDALDLLHCFYVDMASFLLRSNLNLKVTLIVDINLDHVWECNVNQIKENIADFFEHCKYGGNELMEYLDESKYAWLLDFVNSIEEGEQKIDNYAVAASLIEMLKENQNYKFVEV